MNKPFSPNNREPDLPPLTSSQTGVVPEPSPVLGTAPTFTCRKCDGVGEIEAMGLCDDRWHWVTCWDCDGSGVEEPYCGCCGGKLNPALYCNACDEFESLVYVERISPTRIVL